MKITKLEIKDFHQFKDFELDLTYPKGHAKAGQPLEKICIIGQSGTGKTTLLELLGGLSFNYSSLIRKYKLTEEQAEVTVQLDDIIFCQSKSSDEQFSYVLHGFDKDLNEIEFEKLEKIRRDYLKKSLPNLIYFPSELTLEVSRNYDEDVAKITFEKKGSYDFGIDDPSKLWDSILKDIQTYQEEELAIRQEISRIAENANIDIDTIQEAVKKLEDWRNKSFNPVQDIANNCLDPILKKLNLKVKTDLDIKKKDDIGFIKVEDNNKNEIPYGLLSTGTKQILLSALPLYLLKPNQTLIFFDEPERSLYPDLQRDIVNYYQNLTTDSQLFFATHSPIIASSFEPWEIIELKFNREEGYVYQEKYYDEEKGRHVDNYFIDPNFLTIDLILSKVFDLTETHSPVRNEQIGEALMLRGMLEKMKGEKKNNTKKFKELYEKYQNIATKLAWDFDIPTYSEN